MKNDRPSGDEACAKPEHRIPAVALSRGIGSGRVLFLDDEKRWSPRVELSRDQIEAELERLAAAVDESIDQLRELSRDADSETAEPSSGIFGVHLLILQNSSFVGKVAALISEQGVNAEWALQTVAEQYAKQQGGVKDVRFQEKYLDIDDVSERLLRSLGGSLLEFQPSPHNAVIVARELRPSDIVEIAKSKPAAVITERGGWTSHTSILAREFRLPMVSGIRNPGRAFKANEPVIVDALRGEVIVCPTPETTREFGAIEVMPTAGYDLAGKPEIVATVDGTSIALLANVDNPDAYEAARGLGASGIGLYRSESIIRRPGVMPSEAEQARHYEMIADAVGEAGVKIRTFDIGIDQAGRDGYSVERNPSLGLRSIRLSLSDTDMFRTQVRAILKASAGRSVDIVLPMISGVAEVIRSKTIIGEERERLIGQGLQTGSPMVGAMIEVPSAVLTIEDIAGESDFLCLGTNDLVQYLMAADRDNDAVADWYQTLHPAVISSISRVLASAAKTGKPVTVCGEMAGSPFYVPLLIGLGARKLSMNAHSLRSVRNLISGITVQEAELLAGSVAHLRTAQEIEDHLRSHYARHWENLFPAGLLNSRHR